MHRHYHHSHAGSEPDRDQDMLKAQVRDKMLRIMQAR
jgi:hypothetical protein